ncbi:sugar phosphate isomerase/epimerase family protein [Clostridium sp. Marseille-P3244]|uniref:sugar phosphate isomerase/epimerase family protein n=1 Tax=Clostridium sp. Marseille-P3244 TaxID=1871020 RepID=UPI0009309170|nr:TIM barrel protein [Clostridium sp. Marseille-P3244]
MSKDIKIGCSIYSFTYFYDLRLMDLEDLLKTAHEMGYEGIEIVVAQMAPEYPNITDEWIKNFRELLDKYQLHLVSWSAYIDMGLRADRDLTDEEIREHTRRDLILAKKAGADLVRTQHAIKPENFRAMLPLCKQLDMKLCIEMHAPHHPDVPVWQEYLKIMAEPESEGYLGVVPDFSIFQYAPHKQMIENYLRDGFRQDKLDKVIELNKKEMSADEIIAADEFTDYEKTVIRDIVDHYQSPAKLEDLKKLIPYAPYIHGKFHYLDENCHNPCIPYERIIPMVKELGFHGYIASEYEGWDADAMEQLKRYVTLLNRLLED